MKRLLLALLGLTALLSLGACNFEELRDEAFNQCARYEFSAAEGCRVGVQHLYNKHGEYMFGFARIDEALAKEKRDSILYCQTHELPGCVEGVLIFIEILEEAREAF